MKLLPKPLSSPSRNAEKFPPPLLGFLRTNGGSKSSRGRSTRSSPMFLIRKKNGHNETTQEPSSPKVTCMGQVRVKRAHKSVSTQTKHRKKMKKKHWIEKSLFCTCFDGKQNRKPFWRGMVGFWQIGYKKKMGLSNGSLIREPHMNHIYNVHIHDVEVDVEEDEDDGESKSVISSCSSPPKHALLLMRCRSAPYRASSLATRFCETELGYKNPEKSIEEKLGFCEDFKSSSGGKEDKCSDIEEEFLRPALPLILTRCKSEPGRNRSEKIDDLETCFFQRRLGFVDISSTRS